MGFVLFFGVFGGLLTRALYVFVEGWLPEGRWGGLTYGPLLLVLCGTRVDPLRPENPDLDIGHCVRRSRARPRHVGCRDRGSLQPSASSDQQTPRGDRGARSTSHLRHGIPGPRADRRGRAVGHRPQSKRADPTLHCIAKNRETGRVVGVTLVAIALPGFAAALIDIAVRP
jgi:hypothetical protein